LPGLVRCSFGKRLTRQVNRKNATGPWDIACRESPITRLDAASGEWKSQTEAGFIGTALGVGQEDSLDVTGWKASTFILDLDQDPISGGDNTQSHLGQRMAELECIL